MRPLVALGVALLLAACSALPTAPPPSPGSMDDVIAALVRRGVTVHRPIGGDAGCPGQPLHDNAVHLEVSVGSQGSLQHVYLLRWRRAAQFEAAASAFDACVAEFEAAHPGIPVEQVHLAPWRAYGQWDRELRRIVEEALRATGGTDAGAPTMRP